MSAAPVTETAHAKINLALHVTGRRADGYHLLESLVVFARFGDEITVAPANEDRFAVSGPFAADTPTDASNLVLKARDRFRGAAGGGGPLSIHCIKRLPVASGIGGGSADAAATLRAMARLSPASLDLAGTALSLGADVPMCLRSQAAIARGIGEALEPVRGLPPLALVLVNPGVGVSTPAVFGRLERRDAPPLPPLPAAPSLADLLGWLGETANDLEAPALSLAPAIGAAKAALTQSGALLTRMSGSGATCFGIFADFEHAERSAQAIRTAEPAWFVCPTETLS